MNKVIKLIVLLLFPATLAMMVSCETSPKKEQPKAESITQEPAITTPKEEDNRRSFTTALGIFDTEKVINMFYQKGVSQGAISKKYGQYHFAGNGTEETFKQEWVSAFGVPNNSEAKTVYDEALKQYLQGYKEGYNF